MVYVLNILVFWIVVAPFITLIHELAHAAAALLVSDKNVTIIVGDYRLATTEHARRVIQWQWGRLRYVIQVGSGLFVGFYLWDSAGEARWKRIRVALAGPLSSLALTLLFWFIDLQLQPDLGIFDMLLNWAGWAAFISFVFTALPVRYPKWWWSYGGITSDGLRALLIAREANEEKVNAKP